MDLSTLIIENFLDMEVIGKEKSFLIKSKFGPSNYIEMPTELTPDIACFIGFVLGDGNLARKKKRITIELVDKVLIKKIKNLVLYSFNKRIKIFKRIDKRENRQIRYFVYIDNNAIYSLLNRIFEVPIGKKSDIIKIPNIIKISSDNIKKAFLIGVLASDGGKRQNRLGLSTASKKFREDLHSLLIELGVNNHKDQWINKKYKKEYFGLTFNQNEISNTLRECRSGQTGQILDSFFKRTGVQA